jgi:hypothetical protein
MADPEADKAQKELWREMDRLGVENEPCPDVCKICKAELKESDGFAGEPILYCEKHGVQWEDCEGAIRNVI